MREFILAQKALNPSLTVTDLTRMLLQCEVKPPQKNKRLVRQYVSRTIERGTVNYREHNRKKTSRTQQALRKIKLKMTNKKNQSIRKTALSLQLSPSSIYRHPKS
jgi:hypothetical protein